MKTFLTTDPPNDVISVTQNLRIPGFHLENECRTDSLRIITPELSSLDSSKFSQISPPENLLRHPEVTRIKTSAQTENVETETLSILGLHIDYNASVLCSDSSAPVSSNVMFNLAGSVKTNSYAYDFARWALTHKIPQTYVTDLLRITTFHIPEVDLPKTARTLLKSPRKAEIESMGSGKFFYIGVAQGIKYFLKHEWYRDVFHLKLQIATDGLPVGGLSQLWPLLGRVTETNVIFFIRCYRGKSKPLDSNEYFRAFAHEMTSLINNGMLYEGKKIFVLLHSLVCDFPAK